MKWVQVPTFEGVAFVDPAAISAFHEWDSEEGKPHRCMIYFHGGGSIFATMTAAELMARIGETE